MLSVGVGDESVLHHFPVVGNSGRMGSYTYSPDRSISPVASGPPHTRASSVCVCECVCVCVCWLELGAMNAASTCSRHTENYRYIDHFSSLAERQFLPNIFCTTYPLKQPRLFYQGRALVEPAVRAACCCCCARVDAPPALGVPPTHPPPLVIGI